MSKPFKDLTIKDAFMFAAVMVNPDKCGPFLKMVLDMDALLSGKRYRELPDTYVIFICDFPLSKKPLYKYSYHSICSENGECLEDGRTTIFLSTCGENEAEVPKELVDFLKYVKNPGESPETEKRDSYEASVERQVQRIKRDREMEAQYMMLEEMLKDEREAGRKEGHEAGKNEGLKIGRLEGEERTMELVNVLMSQGRFEDLKRCLKDRAFREELLEQSGIAGKEKQGACTED